MAAFNIFFDLSKFLDICVSGIELTYAAPEVEFEFETIISNRLRYSNMRMRSDFRYVQKLVDVTLKS